MRKFVLLIGMVTTALAAVPAFAQTVFEDDFDSYATGSIIDGQGDWAAWDMVPGAGSAGGEALLVNDPAESAPNALEIDGIPGGAVTGGDDIVQVLDDLGLSTGVVRLGADLYVPSSHTGKTYFAVFNRYEVVGVKNWSAQVHFNGADQGPLSYRVAADFSGETASLVMDEWVALELTVNLDAGEDAGDGTPVGSQEFKYDGDTLYTGPWRGQVSGVEDSRQNISAVNFYNNFPSGPVYYDNVVVQRLDPWGACCFDDGTCLADKPIDVQTCSGMGGVFQGAGAACAGVVCYVLGDDGAWIIDPSDDATSPDGWRWDASSGHADTCEEDDHCPPDSRDIQWQVTLARDGRYLFDVCDADFDSVLSLGSVICAGDFAVDDDGCGTASRIDVSLESGVYYLSLGGFATSSCGAFTLIIRELCSPSPDADGNGFVEFTDLSRLLASWAPSGCFGGLCPPGSGDVDCDGDIDFTDLLIVIARWDPPL